MPSSRAPARLPGAPSLPQGLALKGLVLGGLVGVLFAAARAVTANAQQGLRAPLAPALIPNFALGAPSISADPKRDARTGSQLALDAKQDATGRRAADWDPSLGLVRMAMQRRWFELPQRRHTFCTVTDSKST